MKVHGKLNEARMRLQQTKLNKSGMNKFAQYSYFELGDFLPTVNTIFSEIGLCGVISFGIELATLTITATEDDSSLIITSPMAEANLKGCHPIQNLGAVETYTRRYLWVTAMEIVEHDALDATTGKEADRKDALTNGKVLPPAESSKSIAKSEWDSLSIDEQNFLTEIAMNVAGAISENNMVEANRLLNENNLDATEKVALWSRFDSKQRSAIKSFNDSMKKAA